MSKSKKFPYVRHMLPDACHYNNAFWEALKPLTIIMVIYYLSLSDIWKNNGGHMQMSYILRP
jgi:hypothetical protein